MTHGDAQPNLWRRAVLHQLSWSGFDAAIQSLANQVRDTELRFDHIVGVCRGGLVPAVALANALDIHALSVVHVSRNLGSGQYLAKQSPVVRWQADVTTLRDARVLVVDDVAGSGETLDRVRADVDAACVTPCHTAVLVRMRRGRGTPDMVAVELDDWVIFPWEDQAVPPRASVREVTVPDTPVPRSSEVTE